jgi:O-antigen biosynthesis protein WbqL
VAAILDVSDSELLPLRNALGHWRSAARARLWEGGQLVPPRPMLWACPLDELADVHSRRSEAPPADLHVVRNVIVGGRGAMAMKDRAFVHAGAAYPGYVREYIADEVAPETWAFPTRGLRTLRVRRAYALLHHNLMWGHWLTEVFPKLFAIRELRANGVEAPILVPSSAPSYVIPIIQDLLPGQALLVYDPERQNVRVGRLLLPPMLQHFYVFHPRFGEALDNYARGLERPPASSRIFVSRGGMRTKYAYRELVNEPELEGVAAEFGFRIVRPETLPWREQVALFAGARVIAGEFGSGLHNTIFSPPGSAVVALNCIGEIQSRIANFRRQDIGYVLPDDGRPRGFRSDGGLQRYRVDPTDFREKLSIAIEAAGA